MKKIFYAFLFCYLGFLMSGCDQDIDFPYEGKDRIQFQHYTVDYNDIRHYSDSIKASFGLLPDSIKTDTIKVVMEYLGKGSEQERTYHVSVLADSTTAIAGTHYQVFSEEQNIPSERTDRYITDRCKQRKSQFQLHFPGNGPFIPETGTDRRFRPRSGRRSDQKDPDQQLYDRTGLVGKKLHGSFRLFSS